MAEGPDCETAISKTAGQAFHWLFLSLQGLLWFCCAGHAGVEGNDQNRLAGWQSKPSCGIFEELKCRGV